MGDLAEAKKAMSYSALPVSPVTKSLIQQQAQTSLVQPFITNITVEALRVILDISASLNWS